MFAEVVLKRRLPAQFDTLTYKASGEILAKPGQAVVVPFGKTRTTGVVTEISRKQKEQNEFSIKNILCILSEEILLRPWQIALAKWISEYYLCPLSRVIPLFLPKRAWEVETLKKLKTPKSMSAKKSEVKPHHHELTTPQKNILATIEQTSNGKFLIHGVTGSGKTEIYLRLAKKKISEGFQALFLVPEISLTPQLIDFIQSHFENTPLTVIHSKLSERERDAGWLKIHSGETKIIVGSRSAIFSPFQKLGLILMDEEHEWTYKQEQMPRYHARKIAEKMAELTGATLVLGSATPDVETYFQTSLAAAATSGIPNTSTEQKTTQLLNCGKFNLLSLPDRIADTPMPRAAIVDMRDEIRKKNFSMFSDLLREKLAQTLASKKQAILFLNRRGVAPVTICRDCGYVARCGECEVATTLHRLESGFVLICHHCGKRTLPPVVCPECDSHYIKSIGIGTERVEEEIQKLFSLARVCRADSDTISKRTDYHRLYEKLKNHEIDILIGTQMIAKGLDLPQVHLVGAILADTSLHFPDFRAAERTFQLLTQVAGRAGRRKEQGEVIIQTYNPEHYAIEAASQHDYDAFYEKEIEIRRELNYPPFSKIIRLNFSHENTDRCREEISELKNRLVNEIKKIKDESIKIASCPAIIPKLHGKFHFEILMRGSEPEKILKSFLPLKDGWKIDVDPL